MRKNECWLWEGSKNRKGYGQVRILGKMLIVSRVSYRLFKGSLGIEKQVMHTCDVPACWNPAHLLLGDNSKNQRDCVAKGRHWNTRKTLCPKGHAYERTRVRNGQTHKECIPCQREAVRRFRAKTK